MHLHGFHCKRQLLKIDMCSLEVLNMHGEKD